MSKPIPQLVVVQFEDQSVKKFAIGEATTVEQLKQKVVHKLDLKHDIESFGIYEVQGGRERFLTPTDVVKISPSSKLLFKKRFFYHKHETDETLTHLEFIQVREDVLRGNYCCNEEETILLAGLDMRVEYGTYEMSKHKPGFLTSANQIPRFVPSNLLKNKKPEQWEKAILQEYAQWTDNLTKGAIATAHEAKLKYLDTLQKAKEKFFGSVFFDAFELEIQNKLITDRIKVTLAVSKYGIVTFKHLSKTARTVRHQHSFQEILGWAVHQPSTTFIYTVQATESEEKRYTFECDLADEIPAVCHQYVAMIMEDMNKTQGTAPEGTPSPDAPAADAPSTETPLADAPATDAAPAAPAP